MRRDSEGGQLGFSWGTSCPNRLQPLPVCSSCSLLSASSLCVGLWGNKEGGGGSTCARWIPAGITLVAYQGGHAVGRPEGLLGPASGRHQRAARAIPQLGAGVPSHPQALLCCPMTLQTKPFLSFPFLSFPFLSFPFLSGLLTFNFGQALYLSNLSVLPHTQHLIVQAITAGTFSSETLSEPAMQGKVCVPIPGPNPSTDLSF